MQRCYVTVLSVFAVLLATSTGCGDPGGGLMITGTVTLDGEPLPDGLITILPMEDGKANSADIAAGKYKILAEPGKYKVEISRMVSTGAAVADPDYGTDGEQEESISSRYNANSELRMEVIEGDSEEFNFTLEK